MSRDALVVGINTYQYLQKLQAPARDAEAIAHQLETYGDFRVTRFPEIISNDQLQVGSQTPVSLTDLETALVRLFKPKGNTIPQTALFYFSGHGMQREAGIREGFLATSETNPDAHFYGLSLFWLRRLLQESPVRQRIILLDCCHSGEILNFLEADPGAKSGTDRLFMAASREYEAAYEAINSGYSVFTQALVEGLDPRRMSNGIVSNYALSEWVSTALKQETQQPLFENSGSEIILTRCQSPLTLLQPDANEEVCPYRGLEYFDEEHADFFFGREDLTDQLLDQLRTGNFAAVVGASGSGKSSLVRAGLMHRLRRNQRFSCRNHWQIKLITPTDQPLRSLAAAFIDPEASAIDRAGQLRRAEHFLKDGGTGLSHLVQASLHSQQHPNSRMVLIIDQFEEVFTLCQGAHAERDRHRFFNGLLGAIRDLGDRFSVVIVLRADFFGKCSLYNGLAEQIEQHLVMVKPLTYEQIKASILKPADKVGLFCEPSLVYNILMDIVGAPGELPLLQYTLMELWQHRQKDLHGGASRLTLDAYTELGGVRGTLQKRADQVFFSLDPAEQKVAKRIFVALTQLGEGTEDTRRRILKSELVSPRVPVELVEQVLEKLVAAKLIVTNQLPPSDRQREQAHQQFANISTALRLAQLLRNRSQPEVTTTPLTKLQEFSQSPALSKSAQRNDVRSLQSSTSQETVDIAHETLIRHWGLLRSWLDENREMLRRQRRIERAAREWDSAQQPRSLEYLLRGSHLVDAEDFLQAYPHDLSALAQQYIAVSQEEYRTAHRELRLLQIAVPCTLFMALGITFYQYRAAVNSELEKDQQLKIATSRQWAAIAQSILQDPQGDPSAALLISRLAAEQSATDEAQASLRVALRQFRLQAALPKHSEAIHQVAFSPTQQRLAMIGQDGNIRLWSLATQQEERTLQATLPLGSGSTAKSWQIAFTPNGQKLAAIGYQATAIQVWATDTEALPFTLTANQPLQTMVISRHGEWIAAVGNQTIWVWQLATGKLLSQTTLKMPIRSVADSPDGEHLVIASGNSIIVWQPVKNRVSKQIQSPSPVNHVVVSPDGKQIAAACQDGVRSWQLSSGQLAETQTDNDSGQHSPASQVIYSPDGAWLVSINLQQQLDIWHLQSGRHQRLPFRVDRPSLSPKAAAMVAFSPNSQQLVIVSRNSATAPDSSVAHLWDLETRQTIAQIRGSQAAIQSVQFSPDGSILATADDKGATYLWSATGASEVSTPNPTNELIRWLGVWQPPTRPEDLSLRQQLPQSTTSNPASDGLLALTSQGVLHRWDTVKRPVAAAAPLGQPPKAETQPFFSRWVGTLMKPLQGHLGGFTLKLPSQSSATAKPSQSDRPTKTILGLRPVDAINLAMAKDDTPVAVSPDGKFVAKLESPTTVSLRRLRLGRSASEKNSGLTLSLPDSPFGLSATAKSKQPWLFSPTSQILATAVGHKVHLWDTASGKLLASLAGHTSLVNQVQFSQDGQVLATAGIDRTTRIWEATTGKLVTLLQHPMAPTSIALDPTGQKVLVAIPDGTATLFDTATRTPQVILAGHREAISKLAFSPEGSVIVTASSDGTARLWDAKTGTNRAILPVNAQGIQTVSQVFFSPDGHYVAVLDQEGRIHWWAATWEQLLDLARDRSLRQLTSEECFRYLRLPPNLCPTLPIADRSMPKPKN